MDHYQNQLTLAASPSAVYKALTTQEGLRGWWTQTCEVAGAVGGEHTFRFNQTFKVMKIDALLPDSEVSWLCTGANLEAPGVQSKNEWLGTRIVFRLSPAEGGKTLLDFEHIGLTPALQCFDICQSGWNLFLGSLQKFVETGQGAPFIADTACPSADAAAPDAAASTDKIERSVHIKAPLTKVWRALSNAEEYGNWFGANLKGQTFTPGKRVQGPITISGFEHVLFDVVIERVEPENLLAYRWHPYAVDAAIDYSKEDRTLVTFTLKEAAGGTLLTVTETGFDKVPPERRQLAFRMNSGGWEGQLRNINRYASLD